MQRQSTAAFEDTCNDSVSISQRQGSAAAVAAGPNDDSDNSPVAVPYSNPKCQRKAPKFKGSRKGGAAVYIGVSPDADEELDYSAALEGDDDDETFEKRSTLELDDSFYVGGNLGAKAVAGAAAPTASLAWILGSIAFWYACSMSLTALNKYMFDVLGFNYPLFVTFIHFTVISLFLRAGFRWLKFFPEQPKISRANYIRFMVPIALFGSAEISLSNLAYSTVSISVMTVIKSSLVVMTYVLAVMVGLERFSARLLSVVMFIVGSICLTIQQMEVKNTIGVIFLSLAVLAAAIRWVIIHHQLQCHNYAPLQLMYLTQPLSALFMAIPAFFIDVRYIIYEYINSPDPAKLFAAACLVSIAVVLAFLVVFAEFQLVRVTSSLSLTVSGIGKEIATIIMSMVLFGDEIDLKTGLGILSSIIGIVIYTRIRLSMARNALLASASLRALTTTSVSEASGNLPAANVSPPNPKKKRLAVASPSVSVLERKAVDGDEKITIASGGASSPAKRDFPLSSSSSARIPFPLLRPSVLSGIGALTVSSPTHNFESLPVGG